MPSREQVLDRNQARTETAEERAARQMAAAYNQARREILARLIEGWTGAADLTPDAAASLLRQSGLLQQIDARLGQLEREVGITLRGIVDDSTDRALTAIRSELALLPASLRPNELNLFGTINTRMVEQFVPVAMADWRGLTTSMSSNLQRELQVGLIQGESFPALSRRLLGESPGENAVFPRARTSADLATRRLVIQAENTAKQTAIAEVAQSIPDIGKQAIAAVGVNTTDCCLRAHGQTKPVDQPFELVGEPRFADFLMTSPFHWNCRTGIAMHHPFFEEAMPTDKLKADAQRELKRRQEEKGGKTRKSDTSTAPTPPPVATVRSPEPSVAPVPAEAAAAEAARRAEVAAAEAEAARVAAEVKRAEAEDRRRRAEEIAAAARAAADRMAADARAAAQAQEPAQSSFQYQPSARQLARVTETIDAALARSAQRNGVPLPEFEKGVSEGFRKLVDGKELAIQFKSANIDKFLSDPRLKTQFETNSSGGALNQDLRADAEFSGLGAPLSLDPKDRPIYGYVNLGRKAQNQVSQYGDVTFILKEDVRQRTTVTMDDSLYNFRQGNVAGTPINAPEKASWDGQFRSLYRYNQTGDLDEIFEEIPYVEIQIQRGVSIGDVRGIIDRKGALSAAQRQRFKEMGVEVWDNHD